MKPTVSFSRLISITYLIGLSLSQIYLAAPSLAQPAPLATPTVEADSRPLRFNLDALTHPEQMQRRGAPGSRAGAGTRGDCPAVAETTPELTALVPLVTVNGADQTVALGTTTQMHPTISIYVPYAGSAAQSIKFVLLDDTEMPLLPQPLEIVPTQLPGLVNIQLPETVRLEVGRYYRWYVLIDCQPIGASDVFVTALIQRVTVDPVLARQLADATPSDRIALYAQYGIWHDALSEVQALDQAEPNSALSADWASLLESVGLAALISVTQLSP
jgi:hypothetical protein